MGLLHYLTPMSKPHQDNTITSFSKRNSGQLSKTHSDASLFRTNNNNQRNLPGVSNKYPLFMKSPLFLNQTQDELFSLFLSDIRKNTQTQNLNAQQNSMQTTLITVRRKPFNGFKIAKLFEKLSSKTLLTKMLSPQKQMYCLGKALNSSRPKTNMTSLQRCHFQIFKKPTKKVGKNINTTNPQRDLPITLNMSRILKSFQDEAPTQKRKVDFKIKFPQKLDDLSTYTTRKENQTPLFHISSEPKFTFPEEPNEKKGKISRNLITEFKTVGKECLTSHEKSRFFWPKGSTKTKIHKKRKAIRLLFPTKSRNTIMKTSSTKKRPKF